MQTTQATITHEFTAQKTESSFNSVWGNEMQREDFLALASGVRQFSTYHAEIAFVPTGAGYVSEHNTLAGE